MRTHVSNLVPRRWWPWIAGFLAFLWVLVRSGTNPKRMTYPCQQAAMPIAVSWILAVVAFFAGGMLLRRFAQFSGVAILILGAVWFIGVLPGEGRSEILFYDPLPIWEVPDPVSTVFVMDSVPPTSGSLAVGDETVPDEYLPDPAIDTMMAILESQGVYLHRTAEHPDGIVGADNVVTIKCNYQWTSWNTTNTDRVKGLIWQILQHPDGFTGEIIICDNTQEIGTGINQEDNNSEDTTQSIIDVISTFSAKGYPVYSYDWAAIWDSLAMEYSMGDYRKGFIYDPSTKVTYAKFRTPSENYFVSMKYGVWDSVAASYDSDRLCIISFPVLKAHMYAGATIAIKNYVGMLTTAYYDSRYGGKLAMHNDYFFSDYALVARVMAETYPRLTIVDAEWTTTDGPINLEWVENTEMLVASTDPVAASWYAAKFILTPIARFPLESDPDLPGSDYNVTLGHWMTQLRDSAGCACSMDSAEISVYDRTALLPYYICGDADGSGGVDIDDVVYLISYIFSGGPAPDPLESGDADCSEGVDIDDVVYLISYIFGGGYAPCDTDGDGEPNC